MKIVAIVTAAGSGSRFFARKGSLAKQFQNLNGLPVILHSLLVFQKNKQIDEILVSAERKYFDFIHGLAVKNKLTKLNTLVEGGKTRFQSVKNAFRQIDGKRGDIVLIHDAARPNISTKMVENLLSESRKHGEVIPGVKIRETVKRESKGIITETVNRDNLWLIQTPQLFRYEVLKKSYLKAGRKSDFTDEAALVENTGYRVRIVEGETNNIKITVADELELLKKIMRA